MSFRITPRLKFGVPILERAGRDKVSHPVCECGSKATPRRGQATESDGLKQHKATSWLPQNLACCAEYIIMVHRSASNAAKPTVLRNILQYRRVRSAHNVSK